MRYSGRSRSESEKVEVNGGTFSGFCVILFPKRKELGPNCTYRSSQCSFNAGPPYETLAQH